MTWSPRFRRCGRLRSTYKKFLALEKFRLKRRLLSVRSAFTQIQFDGVVRVECEIIEIIKIECTF